MTLLEEPEYSLYIIFEIITQSVVTSLYNKGCSKVSYHGNHGRLHQQKIIHWKLLLFGLFLSAFLRSCFLCWDSWNGDVTCCIFWPAFGCGPLQTLVEIIIFSVFAAKNDYFDQRLVWAAAKCWSKYTTMTPTLDTALLYFCFWASLPAGVFGSHSFSFGPLGASRFASSDVVITTF